MTMENTVGLSLREAFESAESELSVTEESPEPVSEGDSTESVLEVEQPTVEENQEEGLFDTLTEEEGEQPEGDSQLYEVNGRQMSVDQLIAGNMMQDDYTRKTQELAAEKQEVERAITLMRLLEERPVETIRRLYQQVNSGAPITVTEAQTTPTVGDQTESPVDIEALVEARVAEQLENDPRLKAIQEDQALAQVNAVFSEIEEMYEVTLTDSDKQLVLQTAVDMDTDDLKFVFGGLMNRAQQRQRQLQNAKSASPVQSQPVEVREEPPVVPEKFESFRSAIRDTLREQGTAISQL